METNLEFFIYDHSDLKASYQAALNVINSHTTMSTPLPSSPLNKQAQQPYASFKDPKLDTPNWSGKSCDFYPWLSAVLNRFTLTRAEKVVKVALTMQAILLAKQGPFNNITDWDIFRVKFIEVSQQRKPPQRCPQPNTGPEHHEKPPLGGEADLQ